MKKILSIFIIFSLFLYGCVFNDVRSSIFEMHILNVGQGLCVLVNCDNHFLLYDGGPADSSSYVVSYCKKLGIDNFDYVIASHYDSDHISGLVGILNVFDVSCVLDPDYQTDSKIYRSFKNKVQNEIHPSLYDTYDLSNASFEIVGPVIHPEDDNDQSLCIRITFGKTHYFLCGDASSRSLEALEEIQSDVYVVSHNGSKYSVSSSFFKKLDPSCSIISCGKNNIYGHPDQEVLDLLKNTDLYRTDLQNEIILKSDGTNIDFNVEPCQSFISGEKLEEDQENYQFICNKNSKKIHRPDCSGVQMMKEENKLYTNESKEDLIKRGYNPCQMCDP